MDVKRCIPLVGIALAPIIAALYSQVSTAAPNQASFFLYVGTYGKGIYGYRYDAQTGKPDPLGLLAEITNPSWVTVDPQHKYLYAVSELEGHVNGEVAAFTINRSTGALKPLNSRSSDGEAPCHISVDHSGKVVVAANYGTGTVPVFPIEVDGSLGQSRQTITATGSSMNKKRQAGPHAHETVWAPDNRFLYVPDLGLDQIRAYKFDPAAGTLSAADPAFAKLTPAHGPRHIAISADGKFAYVVNELQPVVTVFSRDNGTGALTQTQELSIVQSGYTGENAPAEIAIDRAGRFLYASNRGPGTISVFSINPSDGSLKPVQTAGTGATWPRGLELDPPGHFMLAGDQKANRFVIFKVDPATGQLMPTGNSIEVSSPVSFVFVPAAQ